MAQSKIEWTEATLNTFVGCTKIATGCLHCYAERIHNQRHRAYLAGKKMPKQYAEPFSKVQIIPERIEQPLHWRKPRKIFWCSMSDMFHPHIPFSELDKVFDVMNRTRHHTHQLLTKRPQHTLEYYKATEAPVFWEHLWLGVSCSTQADADKSVPTILQIPAAVHYVSFEPLLEEIDLKWNIVYPSQRCSSHIRNEAPPIGLGWVIVGCEKLAGNKPGRFCDDEKQWWSACRSIVNQCKDAGVAVFVKQGPINGKVSSEPGDWDEDMRKREYPS